MSILKELQNNVWPLEERANRFGYVCCFLSWQNQFFRNWLSNITINLFLLSELMIIYLNSFSLDL
ncbi:hypothetical protein, partial [Peribacillus simplex]|uniref:hypothetical protein n=1 Tax=Peribacillus simplex TaxID=1478 RepID=UPI0019D5F683